MSYDQRYTMYNLYGQHTPSSVVHMSPPKNKEIVWTIGRTIKWIAIIDTVFTLIYAFFLWAYLFIAFLSLWLVWS